MKLRNLIGEALEYYAKKDVDFLELFHQHMEQYEGSRRFIYNSPDYLCLAEARYDEKEKWHWRVNYLASTKDDAIAFFLNIAPFELDKVAFCRYRHISSNEEDVFKYYKWKTIERISRYGKH